MQLTNFVKLIENNVLANIIHDKPSLKVALGNQNCKIILSKAEGE